MAEAVLALGSNLGDRAANLQSAIAELAASGFQLERKSSVWETPPYPPGQPPFLNAVVTGEISLSPEELLAEAKTIETRVGRTPTYRWGPRVIDIDILFYGKLKFDAPDLVIPHPLIAERAFVLVPLAEVIRGPLPVLDRTADELLATLDRTGIKLTPHSLTGGQTQG